MKKQRSEKKQKQIDKFLSEPLTIKDRVNVAGNILSPQFSSRNREYLCEKNNKYIMPLRHIQIRQSFQIQAYPKPQHNCQQLCALYHRQTERQEGKRYLVLRNKNIITKSQPCHRLKGIRIYDSISPRKHICLCHVGVGL